jgi:ribosomal-protein-alanine N-acetyltransferase
MRRRGIGRALLRKLADKLTPTGRQRIQLEVRETNLSAQLFFKSLGFRAIAILRDFYEDSAEDAYLMQYTRPAAASEDTAVEQHRWRKAG